MTFYRFARAVVLSVFKVVFRVRVIGREHVPSDGVYIVAPSHRSIFDIPFAAFVSKRRIRFMAKDDLFSTRFGSWLFAKLGAIKVHRESTDRAALRASQQALEEGEPLAIFPEGTRRTGPAVEDLFDGVGYLALKLGVPILPVGIGGTEQILPSGKIFPRIHKVAIVIAPPISSPAAGNVRKRSEIAAVTATLQAELQRAFDEAMRQAGARAEDPSAAEAREHV
jgi:1-acyl-sn-glycerol-3-phosphate acyltransferase